MKKLIAILLLFVGSLFIVNSQNKVTYVDTLKSVSVTVSTDETKKVPTIENMQLQLIKSVESQVSVNQSLVEGINSLSLTVGNFTREIEQKNKNDSQPFMTLGYNNEQVNKYIKRARWVNIISVVLAIFYVWFVIWQLRIRDNKDILFARASLWAIFGVSGFFLIQWLLNLIFNPGYYFIKDYIAHIT
jgi:hypothetical protein